MNEHAGYVRQAKFDEDAIDRVPEHSERELYNIFQSLVRQRLFLAGGLLVALAAAAIAIVVLPGRYTSDATLIVQPVGNVSQIGSMSEQATPEIVRSQLEVVRSHRVLSGVIDRLNLANDPEFAADGKGLTAAETRAEVIENVADNLEVDNDGRSVTIHIAFTAKSPAKAAQIADAIAEEYIRTQGELKGRAIEATKQRLNQRLSDLRAEAFGAEEAAEAFRAQAGLIAISAPVDGQEDSFGATYSARLLGELSRQAANLSAEAALARAQAAGAEAGSAGRDGQSTPAVLVSPVIAALRQQDADLVKSEAQLTARYTADHPLVADVRAQRSETQRLLSRTTSDIRRSLVIQAQSAMAAEGAIVRKADALEQRVNREMAQTVRYRQLQREAKIKRQTYENFATEAGVISERALLQLPDAQIVSPASMPISASGPNRALIFAAVAIAVLAAAFCLAIAREFRASRRDRS